MFKKGGEIIYYWVQTGTFIISEMSVLLMQRIEEAIQINDDAIASYQQQEHREEELFSESTKLPAVQTAVGRKSTETWKSAMFFEGG